MKTKRNVKNSSSIKRRYTKKNIKAVGGNDKQECGINDNGEKLPDCPIGYRCKKHKKNEKGVCIISILVIKYNDEEIQLNAPEVRHSKWNMQLIQEKVEDFMNIYNNHSKYTKSTLSNMIEGLISQLGNHSIVTKTSGDTTRDEKIIRYIMLREELENKNIQNIPKEIIDNTSEDTSDNTNKESIKTLSEDNSKNDSNTGLFSLFTNNKNIPNKNIDPLTKEQIENIDKLQEKLGLYPGDIDEIQKNKFIRKAEDEHHDFLINNNQIYDDFLYPDFDDPNFNVKIAKRKEFFDTQYDGTIYDVKEHAEKMCNSQFELMPHQLFVKNFYPCKLHTIVYFYTMV